MEEVATGYAREQVLVSARKPHDLMGEDGTEDEDEVIVEDRGVDDHIDALMEEPAGKAVDLFRGERPDLPQRGGKVPAMVEEPAAGEHPLSLTRGNAKKRVDPLLAEDRVGAQGDHEIQPGRPLANDVFDDPCHERQRARSRGVRGEHEHAFPRDHAGRDSPFHDPPDVTLCEPCLRVPASCRHSKSLPRLLHSRILENIIRKKGVSGASSAQSPTHLVYHLHSFRYIAAVEKLIFRDFLSRFDAQGQFPCSCGLTHGISVRNVVVEAGALARGASLLADEMGSKAAVWVLSDENTERAAGAEWKKRLSSPRIVSHVLPGNPRPVPSAELAAELAGEVRAASADVLVSVGSGVISDLVKKVSRDTGVPNWCVATAASVDAFSSATAAIHVGGFHNAVPAAVSRTIICDLEVIEKAPEIMILAGLGDLLAKFIAYLDWNLSRIMTGEHYCPIISGAAIESARLALKAARRLEDDPREAARAMTDAVLTSGFAMQAFGGSRPAASAEHTVAHFWEIADAVPVEPLDLHGILVGVASRIILQGYTELSTKPSSATRRTRTGGSESSTRSHHGKRAWSRGSSRTPGRCASRWV